MTITSGDIVTATGLTGRYRVTRITHGQALIWPLTRGTAHVVRLSRIAQAATVPTT